MLGRCLHLSKGQLVDVEGRLQTRQWDDDAGKRQWKTEVVVASIELLLSRDEEKCRFRIIPGSSGRIRLYAPPDAPTSASRWISVDNAAPSRRRMSTGWTYMYRVDSAPAGS